MKVYTSTHFYVCDRCRTDLSHVWVTSQRLEASGPAEVGDDVEYCMDCAAELGYLPDRFRGGAA